MKVFVLDSPKLNEIIYNMENQSRSSVIKIDSGEIVYYDDIVSIDDTNYYPLPKWGPVEGFRMMNEFVSDLKNPIVKQELKAVLKQGHGVFRKFKNTLKSAPEIEKIWYTFKKNEIKATVLNWYNQIREYAGLDIYENDQFDEDELLDFDFTIDKALLDDFKFIAEYDKAGFKELYSNYPVEILDDMYDRKRDGMVNESMFDNDLLFIARNPSGEMVGFVWAASYVLSEKFSGMDLLQLFVIPEYRGLGIGKKLLHTILEIYRSGDFDDFIVNCQGETSWLITYLELEGYKIASQELCFRL